LFDSHQEELVMALSGWLKGIMVRYGVPFEEHHHAPVFSASHLAHAEHISGHRVVKTVLLADQGRPIAVVLPASARLDLNRVQTIMGRDGLRLASEEEIGGWFKGCHPSSVPPLRLRSDLGIVMDRSLACLGTILFAAGTPEDAVAVRFRDWYRAVRPGVGRFVTAGNGKPKSRRSPTVLVVEDETETNSLLCQLLERQGLTCQGAEEGSEALALASATTPSAILLDVMLPDMSGFDVYERLRKNGPIKRIPTIVVTALDDEFSRQRSRQLGADAYLTKPFLPATLLQELEEALADARA
jgi:CheY-like chemotaxis protein/prolyl-tRNA editing enzyme YbaK/EbsC (Cys-tRNA(Pro) deacylase)